jgi:hypothetical protein
MRELAKGAQPSCDGVVDHKTGTEGQDHERDLDLILFRILVRQRHGFIVRFLSRSHDRRHSWLFQHA